MNIKFLIKNFYNYNIQLCQEVIFDILNDIFEKDKKVLIFGMGYDSLLWYKANKEKDIFFVENNDNYIDLNNQINNKNIIKYNYEDITVYKSLRDEIDPSFYKIPQKLLNHKPFDLILIDGPAGYSDESPGRELPFYWSRHHLMHDKTKIYIDDTKRNLESHLIEKYYSDFQMKYYDYKLGSASFFL